jgi:hypothetical protein
LALAVIVGLNVPFQLGKEPVRVLYLIVGLAVDLTAALIAVRFLEHSHRSMLMRAVLAALRK